MIPLRMLIVAFYLIRCPVAAYRVTVSALELARMSGAAGVNTYATEPSTRHPAVSKTSDQNLRGVLTGRVEVCPVLSTEPIRLLNMDRSNRLDSRQQPVRSPPSSLSKLHL